MVQPFVHVTKGEAARRRIPARLQSPAPLPADASEDDVMPSRSRSLNAVQRGYLVTKASDALSVALLAALSAWCEHHARDSKRTAI